MKKNIYAINCPADKIREYIENLITIQNKFKDQGKDIKEKYNIPDIIEISPENMKFLIESKYVDFWGAGKTGNELNFYWKKTDTLPALEVRTIRLENGKFYLSYIKEDASKDKEEFEWVCKNFNLDNQLIVSKQTDALEDICDMSYNYKKR